MRHLVHEAERGEREALDHDLHAEVGHVPAAVGDDVVEQQLEVRVDRVVTRELLVEVAGEHLDVAGLVHHLRRRVVLGVDPRHGLDDLRGADQRALLAVQELRERPVLRLDAELDPLLVAPLLERRVLGRSMRLGSSVGLAAGSPSTTASWSTSVDQSRSVVTFHCDVLAFS